MGVKAQGKTSHSLPVVSGLTWLSCFRGLLSGLEVADPLTRRAPSPCGQDSNRHRRGPN